MLEENWKVANKTEEVEIEAIFVNDFPAETLKIEKKWAKKVSWVIIENEKNSGIHFSRVQGFLHSKGEYILFLDQDDEISPIYLREQLKELESYDANICNGKNYSDLIYRTAAELKRAVDGMEYKRGYNRIVSPGQVLLRRRTVPLEWVNNILRNNGADDYFLWMLIFIKNYKVGIQEKVLYWRMISETNASKNRTQMYESVYEMLEKMENMNYLTKEDVAKIKKIQSAPASRDEASFEEYEREKNYKLILDFWMTLRNKKISIAGYLTKRCFVKIVIYGGGILGKHLCHELKESNIQVECILDRNKNIQVEGMKVAAPGEPVETADAIIVTPFMEYEQIKRQLKEFYTCEIISIETLLYNADCKLMTK